MYDWPRAQSSFLLHCKVNGLVYLNSQLSWARTTSSVYIKACDKALILLGHLSALSIRISKTEPHQQYLPGPPISTQSFGLAPRNLLGSYARTTTSLVHFVFTAHLISIIMLSLSCPNPGLSGIQSQSLCYCTEWSLPTPNPNSLHYLVEPFHDHIWEVFVQHRRWDDHFIKCLIVTPDSKVSGILLLTATGRGVGIQRGKEGAGDERAGQYFGMQKKEPAGCRQKKQQEEKQKILKYTCYCYCSKTLH